jgi:hypothetical protein
MHACIVNWVLKFEDPGARVIFYVPLAHGAILGCAEKTSIFKGQVVYFVQMSDQWSQLVDSVS